MARIAGVDLPKNKRMEIALTYIYGIGKTKSRQILQAVGIDLDTKTDDLKDEQVSALRSVIDKDHKVEGDLRRESPCPSSGSWMSGRIAVSGIERVCR